MLVIKRFNKAGLEQFRKLLHAERTIDKGSRGSFDKKILDEPKFTESLETEVQIDTSKSLSTRCELGEYIRKTLEDGSLKVPEDNYGVWAWLACAFMDMICPLGKKLGADALYIPSEYLGNPGHFFRHLIRGPYSVVKGVTDGTIDEQFGRLLLVNRPDTLGRFYDMCYGNQRVRRNKTMQKCFVAIYGNSKGGLKKGSGTIGKAGMQRFIKIIIPRVQENFDIEKMTVNDFIEAWGDEIKTSRFMS